MFFEVLKEGVSVTAFVGHNGVRVHAIDQSLGIGNVSSLPLAEDAIDRLSLCILGFCNPVRLRSTLGYLFPTEFERQDSQRIFTCRVV